MTELKDIIRELILLFEHLCEVEHKKLNTVEKNRITLLEECMNEEQAAILRLRGLDKRREQCMASLGFGSLTFRELLEKVPEEEKKELEPLFEQLSAKVKEFQELSDCAQAMININLHHINQAISQQAAGSQQTGTMTNKKI